MKQTLWTELILADCTVVERDGERGMRVSHPLLKRPRWFILSRAGNYYSRYTGREHDEYGVGYIIVKQVAIGRAHPRPALEPKGEEVKNMKTIVEDDRNASERDYMRNLVIGTDSFMSGWGKAKGGVSYAAWACTEAQLNECREWVESRSDMKRVRAVYDGDGLCAYRPSRNCAHMHIYVYGGQRKKCN